MKLSVALCTYNGARYIQEQLESIVGQSLTPDEIVVCDDGSTDGTLAIVEELASRARMEVRIYRNRKNVGSTKNFENAIRHCKGEIIALADQDDVWLPEKLEKLVGAFTEDPEVSVVFSDAEVVDEALNPLNYRLWESGSVQFGPRLKRRFLENGPMDVLIRRHVVTGATMAFRSKLRDIVLPIDESWIHDGWIAFLAAASGTLVRFIDEPLILYRQHHTQQIGASKPSRETGLIVSAYKFLQLRYLAKKHGKAIPAARCDSTYLERARDAIEGRISQAPCGESVKAVINLVDGKITHLKNREALLTRPRVARLWPVLREIVNGNYVRYNSNFIIQCGKDVLY